MSSLWYLIILFILGNGFSNTLFVLGEYNIRDKVPSFLYHAFDNLKEDIFPQSIQIKMSLRRISGTLLYSIDKNMNQLIVSLHEVLEPTLGIEFRKKEVYLSLSELCGCKRCRYQVLDLKIEITDNIYIVCNGRSAIKYPYVQEIGMNEAYPQMLPHNISTSNNADLWLVNTDYAKGLYPNQEQLAGCIFNVLYNNKDIIFTKISGNIVSKCVKTCKNYICNGGECIETYNNVPLCNCTQTFFNGDYCNETLNTTIVPLRKNYFFEMLKISWRTSSKEILKLNNSKVQIQLYSFNSSLFFEYTYVNTYKITSTCVISQNYVSNKEYILILNFLEGSIIMQFFNNYSWNNYNLYSYLELSGEKLSAHIPRRKEELIELAYKSNKGIKWRKVHSFNIENAEKDKINLINENNETLQNTQARRYLIIFIIIYVVTVGALLLSFVIYRCKSKRVGRIQKSINLESQPLIEKVNILDEDNSSWTFAGKRRLFQRISNILFSFEKEKEQKELLKKIEDLSNNIWMSTKEEEKICTELEKVLKLDSWEESNEPTIGGAGKILERLNSSITSEEKIQSRLQKILINKHEQVINLPSNLFEKMNKIKADEEKTLSNLQGVLDYSMDLRRRNRPKLFN